MNDDNQQEDINQVPASSPDFKTELAKKLQEIAPEVIADGKVDTKKLKELLDEDSADDSERFGLFWPGKKRAMRAAQEPTTATLKPAKEESKDWDTTQNIFIEGDNLEVLKILQKYYHNKIKMIYIDPPYNTGKDFVYPDNYKEGLASYLEFTKQVNEEGKKISTNSDTDGRYHSNWLNMMYPRLKLARNLLTDEGVIFISIGDDELSNLLKICTEIYGENNFLGLISRRTKAGGNAGDYFSPSVDYILVFARNSNFTPKFRLPVKKETIDSYNLKDSKGRYKWRSWYDSSLTLERSRNAFYGIKTPDGKMIYPPTGKRWRNVETSFTQKLHDEEIEFRRKDGPFVDAEGKNVNWTIHYKLRPSEKTNEGSVPDNLLTNLLNAKGSLELNELNIPFDFSKPSELITYLIKICTSNEPDSLIFDFFSGSGTTAHAVMQLNAEDGGNRKHIQVQLPEPTDEKSEAYIKGYKTVVDISKERIRRAGEKINQEFAEEIAKRDRPLDVGFKLFKLADTNFSKWQTNSDVNIDSVQQRLLEMRESSDDNSTQEDLLAEILIKLGFPLTTRVTKSNISELNIWDVSDKAVIAYLDEHTKPTLDQLRTITDTNPGKIVILEDSFQGDDELKTNLSQICKSNDIELRTV